MSFEEENNLIEHEIILSIVDKEIYSYDYMIELSDDNKFIKDILKIHYKKDKDGKDTEEIENKIFKIREDKTWWSFPLYEIKDSKIIDFDYTKYIYFANADRRMILTKKINALYNLPSELKIIRKTLKYIMDVLKLNYPDNFSIMDKKIEEVINKNPKDKNK